MTPHRTPLLSFILIVLVSLSAQNSVGLYGTVAGTSVGLHPAKQKCWAGFWFGPCTVTNGGIAGGTFSYDFDGQTLRSNFTVIMTDIACFNDAGGLAYGMKLYQPSWEYRIVKDGPWFALFGLGSKVIYDNVIAANLTNCSYDSSNGSSMKAFQSISVPMQIPPIQVSESGSYHFQIQAQLCCNDALHGLAGLYKYRYWTDWSYSYSFHLEAATTMTAGNITAFSTNTFATFAELVYSKLRIRFQEPIWVSSPRSLPSRQ